MIFIKSDTHKEAWKKTGYTWSLFADNITVYLENAIDSVKKK